jgi:CBS domain-containing protein
MTTKLGRLRLLTVGDVMTAAVVTVGATATFHEMVMLMQEHGISALPVVDADGGLIGIVSEADLLIKEAPPADASRFWPESPEHRTARAKASAVNAADVMTGTVITVSARSSLSAAARLMREHGIKRLPVVTANGELIGIASRRDLLTAFTRSDDEIRRDIVDSILPGWLGIPSDVVTVSVVGGVVSLHGTVDRHSDVDIIEHVVASLDGVVGVEPNLGYDFDDRQVTPAREGRIR